MRKRGIITRLRCGSKEKKQILGGGKKVKIEERETFDHMRKESVRENVVKREEIMKRKEKKKEGIELMKMTKKRDKKKD